MIRSLRVRVAGLWNKGRREREMAAELESHLQMETEALVRSGMAPDAARRAARLKAGGLEAAKEAIRDQRGMPVVETLGREFRFAGRQLRLHPGFALSVAALSAVGIGGIAVMASALWGVALRPLPFAAPGRLVWVDETTPAGRNNSLSALDYFDFAQQCDAFVSLAARSVWQPSRVLTGEGEPERVTTLKVSGNFFATVGIAPLLGRPFTAEEEVAGGPAVAAVSEEFWERRMSARRDLTGAVLHIDGGSYQVVGVIPRTMEYPPEIDVWFPLQKGGSTESGRGNNNFFAIGRLRDGVTIERAQEQVSAAMARIAREYPKEKAGWGARLTSLHEKLFGSVRPVMYILMGSTLLVLLILCANLSSLLQARAMARQAEFALRRSLGASRAAIARQLLMETLVLVGAGALAGAGLAQLGIRALKALGPTDLPRLATIGLDAPVLLASAGATVLTALLAGIAPAWQSLRTTVARGEWAPRRALVAGQLALSLVLLVMTGLLLRSLDRLQKVDPGLSPQGVQTVDVQIPGPGTAEKALRYFAVLERLRQMPGAVNAAAADQLPFFGGPYNGLERADRPARNPSERAAATRRLVTEGYFETLGIPLLAGRSFQAGESLNSPLVTVVSRSLARQLFGDESPVGRLLVFPWDESRRMEIAGVVEDVRDFGLAVEVRPAFYLSLRQVPGAPGALRYAVRGVSGGAVRQAIREVEKDAPLFRAGTMEQWVANSTARQRFTSFALGAFAMVALLLSAGGLFGLMSYMVARQRHEIGIRIALGAPAGTILAGVVRQGALLAAAGVAAGVPAALLTARLLKTQLYATGPADGVTMATALVVLVAAALASTIRPAVRATRVDCVEALKAER